MGFRYDRLDVSDKLSQGSGVTVPAEELAKKVVFMVNAIAENDQAAFTNPTCVLRDVVTNPFLEH